MDIEGFQIEDVVKGLRDNSFSSTKLTKSFLEKIEEKDNEIASFLKVTPDLATKQAEKADKSESKSPLKGVPVAIKDNILVEDVRATGGSKILEHFIAPYEATVVTKIKESGTVILGKLNMDEFAMGGSTENSGFFPTKNPTDLSKVPGGSSGGPAAAVAADMAVFSLGSDTGGSIRQPAAFCNIVGFKPGYGRVSRHGLMAMASSLDQIGPLTKSVKDSRIVFDAIKGKDKMDATSFDPEKISKLSGDFKIGVPKEYFVDGVEKEVKDQVEKAIEKIKKAGVEVVDISLPHTKYALSAYQLIMASEVSANMARYDGIRYGLEVDRPKADSIEDAYFKNRAKFGKEVKRRIMLGTFALSSGYYEAYYLKAEKVRALIKNDFEKAFQGCDAIITPTSPILPFGLGEKLDNPLSMYLADTFTTPANLAGIPAISIPCNKEGLPVGLQLMGKRLEDEKLLDISEKIEEIIRK